MATETVFSAVFSGRLPSLGGGSKIPGQGLKIKYGKFTVGTAEYPVAGYAAADLATAVGFSYIECIVPCGVFMNNSGADGYVASWDGAARTLKAMGNSDNDLAGGATVGTEPGVNQMAANDPSLDASILWALVIGY